MTDTTTATTPPSLAHADAAVSCGERILWHAQVEQSNVIEDVMETVTPAETISWAKSWAWGAPAIQPDGAIKLKISTTRDEIRQFYTENRSRYQVLSVGVPEIRLSSDWYAVTESVADFVTLPDRTPYRQAWALVSPMDGAKGITGEIVWARFPHVEPAETVTGIDRAQLYQAYLSALRAQDIEALLALMDANVQGAVRDYFGNAHFVNLDGPAQMRAYYERMFAGLNVLAVDTVQYVDRGWYLFTEHRWQVEYRDGPQAGQRGSLLIAELLALQREGRIFARLGYGTDLLFD